MSCPEMLHSCMVHRLGEDLAGANRTINDLRAQQSDTRRKLQGLQAAYAPSNEQVSGRTHAAGSAPQLHATEPV